MLSIAGINIRLAQQRKNARKAAAVDAEREAAEARERQDAMREAIRRDPRIANTDTPESVDRLNQAVESVLRERRLKQDLKAVQEREKQAEQLQDAQKRERESRERRRKEEAVRREQRAQRVAAMPPLRRWIWTHTTIVAIAAALVLGALVVGSIVAIQQVNEARAIAHFEQRQIEKAQEKEREEAARAAALEADKKACSLELAESTTSDEILLAYTQCDSPDVRVATAENPAAINTVLLPLVTDPDPLVRQAAVGALRSHFSGSTTDPVVEALSRATADTDVTVRGLIAGGIQVPDSILGELTNDSSPVVREALARNSNATAETLDRIAWEDSLLVATRLANRPDASPQLLTKLAEHPDPEVRDTVAGNRSTPLRAMRILAVDSSPEVLASVSVGAKYNDTISDRQAAALRQQACQQFQRSAADPSDYYTGC